MRKFFVPIPPRFCTLYASASLRLPYPSSEMVNTCASLSLDSRTPAPTTTSPVFNLIPRTPWAARFMRRTSSSLQRIAMPSFVPIKISWLPVVTITQINRSPSSRLIALRPERRMLRYSSIAVRFTTPNSVTMNKFTFSWMRSRSIIVVTDSPTASGKTLTMAVPRELREPASGTSYALRRYVRPVDVKNNNVLCVRTCIICVT